jgi:hypothetical protein
MSIGGTILDVSYHLFGLFGKFIGKALREQLLRALFLVTKPYQTIQEI